MRRLEVVVSLGIGLSCARLATAEDEAPPLVPPSPAPASSPTAAGDAGASAPTIGDPAPRPGNGAVLAVPGLVMPGQSRPRPALPLLEPAGPAPSGDRPALIGPAEMPGPAPELPDPFASPAPGIRRRPLTLDSVPAGEDPEPRPLPSAPSRPDVGRGPIPPPRRAPGRFGRLFPPLSPARSPSESERDSITVEPRSDPASDAALKRRLEHQIREAYGDRLRSVEVRVVGREVMVRARASRFWQKRAIRRSLESLPVLAGFRSSIEVE